MFCYLFIYLFVYLLHSQTKNPEGNTLGLFYIILWNWTDSQGGFFWSYLNVKVCIGVSLIICLTGWSAPEFFYLLKF